LQTELSNTPQLRVNGLTCLDLNRDGRSEVIAAGRTVEIETEYAAFVVYSHQTSIRRQRIDLPDSRYRYATVADMTGDGHLELVLGGRMDRGETSHALLDVWQARNETLHRISRYCFTGSGSSRLRVVESMPRLAGHLIIGGRLQALQDDRLKWIGFLQRMTFESGVMAPDSSPIILDKGEETRIRALDILDGALITAGFTQDKAKASTAFISIYQAE
jgi:hypothetical protein